jgi:hypothetical protein
MLRAKACLFIFSLLVKLAVSLSNNGNEGVKCKTMPLIPVDEMLFVHVASEREHEGMSIL